MRRLGNNKQSVKLALAVIHEATTDLFRNYFPDRLDGDNILSLFCKVFVTFNVKENFNSSSQLRNAVVQGDHKPEFHLMTADLRRTFRSEASSGNSEPFENDKKCFLFHPKSSFRF